jgi:uncharacterized membrane protein
VILLDGLKIFFGTIFILFVPGFVWSFVFVFKREIDWLERIVLSFGLSIAMVSLSILWLNWLFHVRMTLLNISIIVCALIVMPTVYILIRRPSLRKDLMVRMKNLIEETRQVLCRRRH